MTATCLAAAIVSCTGGPEAAAPSLTGRWRAVLTSPGGELPFTLEIAETDGTLTAVAENGEERVPFSGVLQDGRRVVLETSWYDSEISAELALDGGSMTGRWRKTAADGDSILPFAAERGDDRRFLPSPSRGEEDLPDSIAGRWAVRFVDDGGTQPAQGELEQQGEVVHGTFLTPTGDYRYLAGRYSEGLLRLSTFDGAHAFLFHARARADGSLEGDFWSRDRYHATWTARRMTEDEPTELPDGWEEVGLTNEEERLAFSFPDLEGRPVALQDPRFDGKVVLVNIFGTWCPNCNDEAPLLAEWHRRYADRGLEVVGLAYELTGDRDRDRQMVRRFAERHGIDYPLLLAGTSDKELAAGTLPDLTAVLSYPTTIFVDRRSKVRRIYSGFRGPGTGQHYHRLVAELEGVLEDLLNETVS